MKRTGSVASLTVVLLIAGCGSSVKTAKGSSTSVPTASATSRPADGGTPSTPSFAGISPVAVTSASTNSPASVHETSAPSGACASAQLSVTPGRTGAGAGNYLEVFVFTNTSNRACTLFGHPAIGFLDRNEKPLPTTPSFNGSYSFPADAPALVTITPGATASFALAPPHTGATACEMAAAAVQVIPPNTATRLIVRSPFPACGRGDVAISNIVAGSDGPTN